MLGKLAGMAKAAKDSVVDAVSDVDLGSVKGALASTVETVKAKATDLADGVGDRMTHPADAYDRALSDVARRIGHAANLSLIEAMRAENPYR